MIIVDIVDPDNIFCNTSSWNIIKGNWTYNSTDCSLKNTDSGDGNIVWFGSADGLTPGSNYIHDTFNLTVTMSIHSGNTAGLMFRTGESSTTNNEGPSYYVGLNPGISSTSSGRQLQFGAMDDGWSEQHTVTTTIEYDTVYTLAIHAAGDIYNVYFNGTLLMENITRTEFSTGSIGVRTWMAPTTFYSLQYSSTSDPTAEAVKSCPQTTDYEFCPALTFEEESPGECPSGWTCNGSAITANVTSLLVCQCNLDPCTSGSCGYIFLIANDYDIGSATSDYFPVPSNAVEIIWQRSGGSEDGGVIVQDDNGNTICDVRDGTDTNTMFQQNCDLNGYGGECIRIYAWDAQRYSVSISL